MNFFKDLVELTLKNPILASTMAILATIQSASDVLEPIESQVVRDVFVVLLTFVAIGLVVRLYVKHLNPHIQFAREKLNIRPFHHGLRRTPVSFATTVLIVVALCVASFGPMKLLATHLKPPYAEPQVCFRVALSCRKCPSLLDELGRQVGARCLETDSGGEVRLSISRWLDHRPTSAVAECTGTGKLANINLNKEADECEFYLHP